MKLSGELWKLPAPRIAAAASHPAEAGAAAQISNPHSPCQATELISGWWPYQRWMKRSRYFRVTHDTHTTAHKSHQHGHMQHQKQQLQLAQPCPRGVFFSWGIAMWSSAWPQAGREELKVSSPNKWIFVSDAEMKVWMSTLNPAARGSISGSSATSCMLLNFKTCQEDVLIPPQHLNVNFPSWLSYFCTEKHFLDCEGRIYFSHMPS